jgi:serine/threonine protein kinase
MGLALSSLPGPGTLIAGKYLIERELGAGGMGTVYAARHQLMEKRVALKWLRPEVATGTARGRFLREARAVSRIQHPNVVDVYDVGEHEGALFLVMECLEGETLGAFLQRQTPPLDLLVRLLLPAMRGVARAHAEGIVHRDIKPENIFLVHDEEHPDGLAKVLDFGISKLSDDPVQGTVTQTGAVVGTPAYMCKEQLNGTRDLDGRVDVYAFGVVLYQALAGELPYGGGSFMELVVRIATATPTPLAELRPDLPAELSAIVHRAMAREREDRYASLQDFVRALSTFAVASGCITSQEGRLGISPPSGELRGAARGIATPAESSLGTDPTLISDEHTAPGHASAREPQAAWLHCRPAARVAPSPGHAAAACGSRARRSSALRSAAPSCCAAAPRRA